MCVQYEKSKSRKKDEDLREEIKKLYMGMKDVQKKM